MPTMPEYALTPDEMMWIYLQLNNYHIARPSTTHGIKELFDFVQYNVIQIYNENYYDNCLFLDEITNEKLPTDIVKLISSYLTDSITKIIYSNKIRTILQDYVLHMRDIYPPVAYNTQCWLCGYSIGELRCRHDQPNNQFDNNLNIQY